MISCALALSVIAGSRQLVAHTTTTISFLDAKGKTVGAASYPVFKREAGAPSAVPLNSPETANATDSPPSLAVIKKMDGPHTFEVDAGSPQAGQQVLATLQQGKVSIVAVVLNDATSFPGGKPFKDTFRFEGLTGLSFTHPPEGGVYKIAINFKDAVTSVPNWSVG